MSNTIQVDAEHYLSLMARYNEAENKKENEFDWFTPTGRNHRLVTRYAYYLLEYMAIQLGLKK